MLLHEYTWTDTCPFVCAEQLFTLHLTMIRPTELTIGIKSSTLAWWCKSTSYMFVCIAYMFVCIAYMFVCMQCILQEFNIKKLSATGCAVIWCMWISVYVCNSMHGYIYIYIYIYMHAWVYKILLLGWLAEWDILCTYIHTYIYIYIRTCVHVHMYYGIFAVVCHMHVGLVSCLYRRILKKLWVIGGGYVECVCVCVCL
jgi:hypothetical protein